MSGTGGEGRTTVMEAGRRNRDRDAGRNQERRSGERAHRPSEFHLLCVPLLLHVHCMTAPSTGTSK